MPEIRTTQFSFRGFRLPGFVITVVEVVIVYFLSVFVVHVLFFVIVVVVILFLVLMWFFVFLVDP